MMIPGISTSGIYLDKLNRKKLFMKKSLIKKSLIKKLRLVLVLVLFLFALGETTLYSQENTETTPYTLDLFWGNKIIGNISTTLNTTGITLDYLLLPDYNISIIGSYLTSKGDVSTPQTCLREVTRTVVVPDPDPNNVVTRDYISSVRVPCRSITQSIQATDFSAGAKYHYNYNIKSEQDLDIFGGAGLVHVAIDTHNDRDQSNSGSSKIGIYLELGVKYFYSKPNFNVGYYLRQSFVFYKNTLHLTQDICDFTTITLISIVVCIYSNMYKTSSSKNI